jgi:hypothetical protein
MQTLNERIEELEGQVKSLTSQLNDLLQNVQAKFTTPLSISGGNTDRSTHRPIDVKAGLGQVLGGAVVWNDSEAKTPPINAQPPLPKKGYNKHTHSRFSGGALMADTLELVQYVMDDITNPHSQAYWETEPEIDTDINSKGETVPMIGLLDLIFEPDTQKWGAAAYEIDVRKCYLVQRDENGDIELDANGNEMKSPLFNDDPTKSSIVWDVNAQVYRFLAVYAQDPTP